MIYFLFPALPLMNMVTMNGIAITTTTTMAIQIDFMAVSLEREDQDERDERDPDPRVPEEPQEREQEKNLEPGAYAVEFHAQAFLIAARTMRAVQFLSKRA